MVPPAGDRETDLPTHGRFVRESASEISEMALPIYANPLGNLLGGRVMHLVDIAGALAAMRHSRMTVVTASVDHMTFLYPIHIGEQVILKASVNRVFHTSMEVGVKVLVENLRTGEVRHTSSAYLTFVALDEQNRRVAVPPVIPETEDEIRRWQKAEQRRKYRLELKARAKR
ncbi:MAG: acyl-CoA thioesterase [Bryobacteraceae bacterium]|nr:acyl-CoA thioesterase [Bryobacteraceae bacterium]MDW8379522.1 acyl-CoA thioesterase [Bryobacterales bacterium]